MAAWVKLSTGDYINLDQAQRVYPVPKVRVLFIETNQTEDEPYVLIADPDDQAAILAVLDAECEYTRIYAAISAVERAEVSGEVAS